ncbi:MAG: hypothetical protein K0R19_1274 [Bacillota bacterium]|jgi:predicted secreted protein|nr:hypothetical protein [Bacillota bacterium]
MKDGLFPASWPDGSTEQYRVMLNQYGAEVIPADYKIKMLSAFNKGYALFVNYTKDDLMAVA